MKRLGIFTTVLIMIALLATLCTAAKSTPYNLRQAVWDACAADSSICSDKLQIAKGDKATLDAVKSDYVSKVDQKALKVAQTVIDCDIARQNLIFYSAQKQTLAAQVKQAQNNLKTGKIDSKYMDNLQKQVSQNTFDLSSSQILIDNAKTVFKDLTGHSFTDDFDFADAYFIMDAASIPSSLPDGSANGESTPQLLSEAVKSYKTLGAAMGAYIKAGDALDTADSDFKTGKVEQAAVDDAAAAKSQARIDALSDKADYAKLLYALDCSAQGYLSKNIKKVNSIFISSSDVS